MASRSDEFKNHVNDVWRQAVSQLEEVKEAVLRSSTRFENRFETDIARLRHERDKLLKRLGEQTYKLANQGKVPMPSMVKNTVDRLNEVIDSLVKKQRSAKKVSKKPRKKKSTTGKKKTSKKSTKKKKSSGSTRRSSKKKAS